MFSRFSLLQIHVFAGLLALGLGAPPALAQGPEDNVTLSAVGDLMIGTDFPTNRLPPDEGRNLLRDAKTYFQATDIRFGNLEGTLYDGAPGPDGKATGPNRYLFRTPTRFGERFREAGFNVLSLANNHVRDMGRVGVESTKETLRRLGIQYTSKAGEVADFNVRGIRVGLIAADFYEGARSITQPARLYEEIQQLSRKFDILVVSAHAGGEGAQAERIPRGTEVFLGENRGNSIEFARRAIDLGADLILMHGPHVPRAMEMYRGRLIAYSLGNFSTGQGISISGTNGIAPLLTVQLKRTGELHKGHLASFRQVGGGVVRYDPHLSALKMVTRLSREQFPSSSPLFQDNGFFSASPTLQTPP